MTEWYRQAKIVESLYAEHPEEPDILWQAVDCYYKAEHYDRMLDMVVMIHSSTYSSQEGKARALQYSLDVFYECNRDRIESNFSINRQSFRDYPWNFLNKDLLDIPFHGICIPRSDDSCYFYYPEEQLFSEVITIPHDFGKDSLGDIQAGSCLVTVLYRNCDLQLISEKSISDKLESNAPIYVVWNNKVQVLAAWHLYDYRQVLLNKYFVFFLDVEGSTQSLFWFLQNPSAYLPAKIVGASPGVVNGILSMLNRLVKYREDFLHKKLEIIEKYSRNFTREYLLELFANGFHNLRILFYTSRFTTAVQYVTRDCHEACLQLGLQSRVVIEKDDLHCCMGEILLLAEIAEFQPHIIFRINFPRWKWPKVPANLIWVTWFQDNWIEPQDVPFIKPRDVFIIMGNRGVREFISSLGVAPHQVHSQIYAANLRLADRFEQPGELKSYEQDIALITHTADVACGIETVLNLSKGQDVGMREELAKILVKACEQYGRLLEEESLYFDKQRLMDIVNQSFDKSCQLTAGSGILDALHQHIGNRITKMLAARWLYEANFDIKVWGNEWKNLDWARDIDMGAADNEKIRGIYHSSKIGFAVLNAATMQHRIFEIMSCGALCLVGYLPEEQDNLSINDYFIENEDFVFFHDRQDLLAKVSYYLNHEEERLRIAENGRKKVYAQHSYQVAMQNILNGVSRTIAQAD